MQGWWGAPGFRVPTVQLHGKRGGTYTKQTGTMQTYGSSCTTCIRSRASSRRYTFEACILGRIEVVEGSSCSRAVVEVVVLATVVEVVVHVATVVVHIIVEVVVQVPWMFGAHRVFEGRQ